MYATELVEKLAALPPDTEILVPAVGCCGDGEWVESVLVRADDQVVLMAKEDFDRER